MQATKDSASAAAAAEAGRSEDARLVEAVLQKDRKATAEFVACYSDGLYAYLHRRLVPRVDLVDDLLQEVFLAALENLAAFQGRSSLKAWMLGIARPQSRGPLPIPASRRRVARRRREHPGNGCRGLRT